MSYTFACKDHNGYLIIVIRSIALGKKLIEDVILYVLHSLFNSQVCS